MLVHTEDLVGVGEIAEELAVHPHTVQQWRHRGILPDPVVELKAAPVWRWADIEEWAARTNRFPD